jgi:hypothetical protein
VSLLVAVSVTDDGCRQFLGIVEGTRGHKADGALELIIPDTAWAWLPSSFPASFVIAD